MTAYSAPIHDHMQSTHHRPQTVHPFTIAYSKSADDLVQYINDRIQSSNQRLRLVQSMTACSARIEESLQSMIQRTLKHVRCRTRTWLVMRCESSCVALTFVSNSRLRSDSDCRSPEISSSFCSRQPCPYGGDIQYVSKQSAATHHTPSIPSWIAGNGLQFVSKAHHLCN